MIADVILKNGWYQSLNESGKKIQERSASSMGELMGFTDKFMVFYKNGWFSTKMDGFKHLTKHSIRFQRSQTVALVCSKMQLEHQ